MQSRNGFSDALRDDLASCWDFFWQRHLRRKHNLLNRGGVELGRAKSNPGDQDWVAAWLPRTRIKYSPLMDENCQYRDDPFQVELKKAVPAARRYQYVAAGTYINAH
jgi:hypothetical protein